ncbi:hypothetical protein Q5P01_022958 [Channa striata]|uniref:Uncharacterized protein n=1 Tax=Channa striata TaxID=64152 RepID=A0AA88RXY2_CHASR|nr:hypothetical protein Q5P01_022958 [Channa striata]
MKMIPSCKCKVFKPQVKKQNRNRNQQQLSSLIRRLTAATSIPSGPSVPSMNRREEVWCMFSNPSSFVPPRSRPSLKPSSVSQGRLPSPSDNFLQVYDDDDDEDVCLFMLQRVELSGPSSSTFQILFRLS